MKWDGMGLNWMGRDRMGWEGWDGKDRDRIGFNGNVVGIMIFLYNTLGFCFDKDEMGEMDLLKFAYAERGGEVRGQSVMTGPKYTLSQNIFNLDNLAKIGAWNIVLTQPSIFCHLFFPWALPIFSKFTFQREKSTQIRTGKK